MATISSTVSNGYTLVGNPTTITNTGNVGNTASYGVAVNGPAGTNWTLVNNGLVSETGSYGIGISLANGGVVTNQSSGTIVASTGVQIEGAPGTVVNLGRVISDNNRAYGRYGVYLKDGGTVINGAAGGTVSAAYITSYGIGVKFGSAATAGTLINYGTVFYGQGRYAVALTNGLVVNGPSGATGAQIVSGAADAVHVYGTGTVVNYGTIKNTNNGNGTYYGVWLGGGGTISNLGTASLIFGSDGVYASGNATVVNAGTISDAPGSPATQNIAVRFGAGSNRLIVDPGAVFIGAVEGGSGGSAVLELASGSSAGTLTGLGTSITNFNSLVFDTGAHWKITGNDSANGLGTLGISGFAAGDTIELSGFVAVNQTFASNLLTLGNGAGNYETLHIQGGFATNNFHISNTGGKTDVTTDVACFRRGTRILTDRGEVAVEDLRIGDLVPSVTSGAAEPIVWIGYRHLDCARHNEPEQVWPIRIAAGAFGPEMPHADLFLSPDHAVFVDGVLIPVRYLVNDSTIVQVPVDDVWYYHIELATHEVILAQGLPTETYLDSGDRAKFGNNAGPVALFPDFSVRVWEASGCAPLIVTGPQLASTRRSVSARAEAMDRQAAPAATGIVA